MHIEVALLASSGVRAEMLHAPVLDLVRTIAADELFEGISLDLSANTALSAHVRHIRLFDVDAVDDAVPELHVHPLFDEEPAEEDTCDGEAIAFQLRTLPALEFDGLWESLVYEEEVQPRLLRYVSTAMRFSAAGVDSRVIAWNRVALLHGPPGTGKTSLCRGLAHKLAVRLSATYAQGHLVEVNAHSLFSKWFSESGKMVMAMFARIRELLDDSNAFVCVLVDEVESLAATRSSAAAGTEPSDSIRVVNALLTQLDGLKGYANCLVLATSNLSGAIDPAFIDRADIKQYIGPPGVSARYEILRSSANELSRVGIVEGGNENGNLGAVAALLAPETLRSRMPSPTPSFEQLCAMVPAADAASRAPQHSMMLYAVAQACDGLSGRTLRKLPFLALALFGCGQGDSAGSATRDGQPLPVAAYLVALLRAVSHETEARANL